MSIRILIEKSTDEEVRRTCGGFRWIIRFGSAYRVLTGYVTNHTSATANYIIS